MPMVPTAPVSSAGNAVGAPLLGVLPLTSAESRELSRALSLPTADAWSCERLDGGMKMVPQSMRRCLVSARHEHDEWGTSYVFASFGAGRPGCPACMAMCPEHGTLSMVLRAGGALSTTMQKHAPLSPPVGAAGNQQSWQAHFERVRDVVLSHAAEARLRKHGGRMWEPVPGCPCGYEEGPEYRVFINKSLGGDAGYHKHTKLQDELIKYLTNYNPFECLDIVRDMDLMSFTNGVLVLSERRFVAYPPADAVDELAEELVGRVARHHITAPYTGSTATPMLDVVLSRQFEPEVVHMLMVLTGRLLFRIGERDNWQVMPYLQGMGGTGKSLYLELAASIFPTAFQGAMSSNQEQVFGLDGKYDCDVLIGRDLPKHMSAVLKQELLQSMVSGEEVNVPRKNALAKRVRWKVPLLFASNYTLDYEDGGGQIMRRVVPFVFTCPVTSPDPTLLSRLCDTELPALVARVLHAYLDAAEAHRSAGFWQWCPDALRQAQLEMSVESNTVRRFLALGPEDCEPVYVRREADAYVSLKRLKAAYKEYLYRLRTETPGFSSRDVMDDAALRLAGFEVEDHVKTCGSCGNKVLRPRKCCDAFSRERRTNSKAVRGLELVCMEDSGRDSVDPLGD